MLENGVVFRTCPFTRKKTKHPDSRHWCTTGRCRWSPSCSTTAPVRFSFLRESISTAPCFRAFFWFWYKIVSACQRKNDGNFHEKRGRIVSLSLPHNPLYMFGFLDVGLRRNGIWQINLKYMGSGQFGILKNIQSLHLRSLTKKSGNTRVWIIKLDHRKGLTV